jgi:hypothetical protein
VTDTSLTDKSDKMLKAKAEGARTRRRLEREKRRLCAPRATASSVKSSAIRGETAQSIELMPTHKDMVKIPTVYNVSLRFEAMETKKGGPMIRLNVIEPLAAADGVVESERR